MKNKLAHLSDEELERIANGHNKSSMGNYSDQELHNIATSNESKGFGGIASDAFNKAIQSAINIPSQLMALPGELYGAGKQSITDPKRALQNVGAGFGELGHNVLSAPGAVRDYLAKKDIVSENAPSFRLPESVLPREYDYGKAFGVEGEQPGDAALRGIPSGLALSPLAELAPAITSRIPGISNKAISQQLSKDKKLAISEANTNYNNFFDAAKNAGVQEINRPSIMAGDIVKHSQPKHHEALKKFLDEPTLENAHWAQSDLGFLKRHLEKVGERHDLTSTQHNTLKNVIEAQNRIKEAMFKEKNLNKNPEFEKKYNQLSADYAKKVVPYKQIEELSDFENKKLKPKNLISSLLKDDEFMLGLGKKYPQLHFNQALRSNVAKALGGGALAGLGFIEGKKFIR